MERSIIDATTIVYNQQELMNDTVKFKMSKILKGINIPIQGVVMIFIDRDESLSPTVAYMGIHPNHIAYHLDKAKSLLKVNPGIVI